MFVKKDINKKNTAKSLSSTQDVFAMLKYFYPIKYPIASVSEVTSKFQLVGFYEYS